MGDKRLRAVVGEIPQGGAHIAITKIVGDQHLNALFFARLPRRVDALLIPAVIRAGLWRQNSDGVNFGGVTRLVQQRRQR